MITPKQVAIVFCGLYLAGCAMGSGEDSAVSDDSVDALDLDVEALEAEPESSDEAASSVESATTAATCYGQQGDSTFSARCSGAPGPTNRQYRAFALCTDGHTAYGTWYPINYNTWSRANCGVNRFVTYGGIQFRTL